MTIAADPKRLAPYRARRDEGLSRHSATTHARCGRRGGSRADRRGAARTACRLKSGGASGGSRRPRPCGAGTAVTACAG